MPSNDLLRLQSVLKAMLAQFDVYCRAHGLTYFLVAGSALGAVRHGDMIPWDDDLDVGLLRPDYERLCRLLRDVPPVGMHLQDWRSEESYPFGFAKLRLEGTVLHERVFEGTSLHQGIALDIFPFDAIPRSRAIAWLQWIVLLMLNLAIVSFSPNACRQARSPLKRFVRFGFLLLRPVLPIRGFIRLREWASHPVADAAVDAQRLVSFSMYGVNSAKLTHVARAHVVPPAPARLGDVEAFVPCDAQLYLTGIFGDWNRLPPPIDRCPLHVYGVDFGESPSAIR